MPAVSVVVIAYNDAKHLPAALVSARRQTLRDVEIVVVDDASTDATSQVIADAAAEDSRVRPFRLDVNSGGCSRPRNTGLAHVNGDYVLFLDSDDVLPRRALERLHDAAARARADIACGRMVRRHHHPRRHLPANDELYAEAAVLDGVLARPAQLRDTPACGKLFRRGFLDDEGLRFPEGLLYEDLLFTTTAYAAAARIAIVPQLCYVWNVRREQEVPSITNRREARNWHDRFEIHRRIDAELSARPRAGELQAAKDVKFFTVDWPIFLRDLRSFPPGQRGELFAAAADYVATVRPPQPADVGPGARAAAYLARRRELEATLTAADFVTTGGIGTDLVVADGRVYWTGAHLDDDGGRVGLDVSDCGVLTERFATTPFLAVVCSAEVRDRSQLRLAGVVHDVLGRLEAAPVTASVRIAGRLGGQVDDVAATVAAAEPGLRVEATVDLVRLGRRLHAGVGHELRLDLVLRRGGEVTRVPLTARDAQLPTAALPLPNRWSPLLGRSARLLERNGRLVLDLPERHRVVDGALDLATRVRTALRRGRR